MPSGRTETKDIIIAVPVNGADVEVYPSIAAAGDACKEFKSPGGPSPKDGVATRHSARMNVSQALEGKSKIIYGRYWFRQAGGPFHPGRYTLRVNCIKRLESLNPHKMTTHELQQLTMFADRLGVGL